MRAASSFSILLLLLLFRQGLQLPLRSQASSDVSFSNRTLNCSGMIGEVLDKLDKIQGMPDIDNHIKLMNPKLWRENLCVLLEAPARLKFQHIESVHSNLEALAHCLPEETSPKGGGIIISVDEDFPKYLKHYLMELYEYLEPRVINISSDTKEMKC